MTSNVITVGANKYGVGLYWQPSPDNNVRVAARKAAKLPGYQSDLYVVRPATRSRTVSQYGLGLTSLGHKAGMPVAGGCLANAVPGSYAGAFRVPEGVWFVVVRDDLVDSDGDILFVSEQEAQLRLEQEIARGGLTKVYAPAEWSVDGSEDMPIGSLLIGRKDVLFEDVKGPLKLMLIIGVILILLGTAYGIYSYYQQLERQRAEELARQEAERQRLADELASKQEKVAPLVQYPKTWQEQAAPRMVLLACEAAMSKVPAATLGWRISGEVCSVSGLTISWVREEGLATLPPDNSRWDPVLKTATLIVPLEGIKPRGEEALLERKEIDALILANPMSIEVAELPDDVVAAPPPPPDKPPPPPPPPPAWQKRSVKFSSTTSPWLLGDIVDLPGLIINSMTRIDTGWTIDGTLYEMRNGNAATPAAAATSNVNPATTAASANSTTTVTPPALSPSGDASAVNTPSASGAP